MEELLYPIGNQTFEKIRENGRVYVDKTEFIYKLLKYSDYVFLSRPRRFGKSLLVSTLEAFFKGKRNLFMGLAIDRLMPEQWQEHPVLHLDLSNNDFTDSGVLINALSTFMDRYEEEYGITEKNRDIAKRFEILIRRISKEEGKKIVVLIDEYDSPMVQTMGNGKLQDEMRRILHAFYSTLKTMDANVRFCMLTGVTKYGKMSIFSGLNNLRDISFLDDYSSICGITEDELHTVLSSGVKSFADSKGLTVDETYSLLKHNYDGYHFSRKMVDVYNPYSLLNALADKEVMDYWFETGTPTMLVKLLENLDTDIEALNGAEASIRELSNISTSDFSPLALFYQSGYLTIKGYDTEEDVFILGFPNREVERGFLKSLLPIYTRNSNSESFIRDMRRALRSGESDKFVSLLNSYLADIPYDLRKHVAQYENYYQAIFYSIFYLIGVDVRAEYHTSRGSIDLLLRVSDYVYIMELKINGNADDAIRQIEEKGYASPFVESGKKIIGIGLGFSKETQSIASSRIMEL